MKYIKLILIVTMSILLASCDALPNKMSENSDLKQPDLEETKTPSISKKIQVACVGDSITQGVGIAKYSDSYPSQLSALLGDDWDVKNFGVKSSTLINTGSLPYTKTKHYHASRAYNPDVVVIMLGTNDAKNHNWSKKHHFIADYSTLIKNYKNLSSQPRIYICYPPTVRKSVDGITNKRIKTEVIPKIKHIASINSVSIIDTHTVFHKKKGLFSDDVHPNKAGAYEIAKAVYKEIY